MLRFCCTQYTSQKYVPLCLGGRIYILMPFVQVLTVLPTTNLRSEVSPISFLRGEKINKNGPVVFSTFFNHTIALTQTHMPPYIPPEYSPVLYIKQIVTTNRESKFMRKLFPVRCNPAREMTAMSVFTSFNTSAPFSVITNFPSSSQVINSTDWWGNILL